MHVWTLDRAFKYISMDNRRGLVRLLPQGISRGAARKIQLYNKIILE